MRLCVVVESERILLGRSVEVFGCAGREGRREGSVLLTGLGVSVQIPVGNCLLDDAAIAEWEGIRCCPLGREVEVGVGLAVAMEVVVTATIGGGKGVSRRHVKGSWSTGDVGRLRSASILPPHWERRRRLRVHVK